MLVKICPKCNSKCLKPFILSEPTRLICLECNEKFNIKNSKWVDYPEDKIYTILNEKSSDDDKKKVFDFLNKNKMKFLCKKDLNQSINYFLNNCYIKICIDNELTYKNIFDFLNNTKNEDCHCLNCNKETNFLGFKNIERKYRGYEKVCCKKCQNELSSKRQKENNTCHRMTQESFNSMKKKLSIVLKEKIKKKEFKPCIVNSWRNEKYIININNNLIHFRSSWEAFFNLVNRELIYEDVVIEYEYNKIKSNYIVDFVDYKNRILYEIKPKSDINRSRFKQKMKYAKTWCKKNKYKFMIIDEDWFLQNTPKYKYLLHELENDKNKERLIKNLRKFL